MNQSNNSSNQQSNSSNSTNSSSNNPNLLNEIDTNNTNTIEKLRHDLFRQAEVSNKLETLCLQYRQVGVNLNVMEIFPNIYFFKHFFVNN